MPSSKGGGKRRSRRSRGMTGSQGGGSRTQQSQPSRGLTSGTTLGRVSGNSNQVSHVVRTMPLFGLSTRKRLPYFETIAVTGTASQVYAYQYSANGCFDPNVTGTGHQPNGFDEMMKFFNHYTVVKSRITTTIQNRNSEVIHVGLSLSGSTSYSTDYQQVVENGLIVYTPLTYVGNEGSICKLKCDFDSAKFQGMMFVNDDSDMRGDTASNPAEQGYYQISFWNALTATVPIALLDVFIEYDVLFTEPKKAALD